MKVLLDTNIIVDVLQQRKPWNIYGNKIFLAAACRQIDACITAKEAADIYYFAKKQLKGQENANSKARAIIAKLLSLFEAIDTLGKDCQDAIAINNSDYEDALMIASAKRSGIDCIITRNTEHFKSTNIRIMSPKEFEEGL